jgi:hypothetical protein
MDEEMFCNQEPQFCVNCGHSLGYKYRYAKLTSFRVTEESTVLVYECKLCGQKIDVEEQ